MADDVWIKFIPVDNIAEYKWKNTLLNKKYFELQEDKTILLGDPPVAMGIPTDKFELAANGDFIEIYELRRYIDDTDTSIR